MNAVSRITWPRSSFVGFDRIWNELDTALTNSVDQTNVFPRHNVVKGIRQFLPYRTGTCWL